MAPQQCRSFYHGDGGSAFSRRISVNTLDLSFSRLRTRTTRSICSGDVGGDWAQMHGFFNFYRFVTDIDFWNVIINTLGFNVLNLAITLPLPVILALMFSEMKHARLSKGIQFFMFLPHFLSIVVYVGIVWAMLDDGSVMYHAFWKRFTPSSAAASYNSTSTPVIAAR